MTKIFFWTNGRLIIWDSELYPRGRTEIAEPESSFISGRERKPDNWIGDSDVGKSRHKNLKSERVRLMT